MILSQLTRISNFTVKILLQSIFLLLFCGQAFAGAWVQDKGNGLSITTVGWYVSNEFWDQSNHLNRGSHYRKLEINPYLEYGLTKDLTVGVNAFIQSIVSTGQGSNFGAGDVEIFGRYRLWKSDNSTVSTQILVKVPEAYDHHELPLLGQGQYDVEWRMLYGHSWVWGPSNWFVNVEGGFRKRFGRPADEMRFDWAIGWKSPSENWEIGLKQENIVGLRNNTGVTPDDPFKEQSADYDLYKMNLNATYWVGRKVGIQSGITRDVFGRNTGKAVEPFVALWIKF